MKVICIIPARSGSKGIPDKNIAMLSGKPLIAYTIEAAVKSAYKPRVMVSTDSEQYATICTEYGAEIPYLREPELAEDDVHAVYPVIDMLKRLKENEGELPDVVVMLQPTSPLRQTKHIDDAISLYLKRKEGSVISVTESKAPHYIRIIKDGKLYPIMALPKNFQRQDLDNYYVGNGSIYVSSPGFLLEHETFKVDPSYPYIMGKEYSIDVDDRIDLDIAEALLAKHDKNS